MNKIAKEITVLIQSKKPRYGSGVIINKEGNSYTVLTAAHMVEVTDTYEIVTPDGQYHSVNYSTMKPLPGVDLAVVQFSSSQNYTVAKIGNSEASTEEIEATLERQEHYIEQLAHEFAETKDFIFLGRGINYPIALEGALKLKEISYIHAEGYPAGEMKHGPIALLDAKVPVVAIAMPGSVYEKVISNAQEAKARDSRLIGVTPVNNGEAAEIFNDLIPVSKVDELLSPILTVIPLQLLAYHIAARRGLDVDQPRNLAKSVTVE
ncbi:MAG: SIS domain-containing protein [Microcoleus sp. SIO2G3]|nr:SIS domain-containing protein [Microcoleus sp. SIO2G3]